MDAAAKFRQHLRARGLSTAEAAEAIAIELGSRVDRSTISCIQTGARSPGLALAAAIERFSGGYLMASEWSPPSTARPQRRARGAA